MNDQERILGLAACVGCGAPAVPVCPRCAACVSHHVEAVVADADRWLATMTGDREEETP